MEAQAAVLETSPERIRATIPGQKAIEARSRFGQSFGFGQVRDRIRKTQPLRVFSRRACDWTQIAVYAQTIPDTVLLKYDDARKSGLFSEFHVVTPTPVGTGRWLVGCVDCTDEWIVISRW